jgi:hypothetical protein
VGLTAGLRAPALAILLTGTGLVMAIVAYLVVLATPAGSTIRRVAASRPTCVVVLVPAHDEADYIERCLRTLQTRTTRLS